MSSSASDADHHLPKLPDDLVVEHILKRLPVKSLLRFRCVCRSWHSTIADPDFVNSHLKNSKRYFLCLDWVDPDQPLCSLFPSESLALHSRLPIEIPFVNFVYGYGLIGSCNGLICLSEVIRDTSEQTMYLWNLFTREHKVVRPGHVETSHEVLGFGLDARSNDYKILRILYRDDINRVEIYSLSTDSWRSLESEVPAFYTNRPSVFLNGNLYWLVFKLDDLRNGVQRRSIVSFDLADEVFDEMALPEETFHEDAMVHLAVLDDSLAVFNNFSDTEPYSNCSNCSVWVLREHSSWTKLYSFDVGLVTGVHGSMRNGELLMDIDDERVSWNPITGHYTKLPLSTQCDLVTVAESLVSL